LLSVPAQVGSGVEQLPVANGPASLHAWFCVPGRKKVSGEKSGPPGV
jgi:hypothetical protein